MLDIKGKEAAVSVGFKCILAQRASHNNVFAGRQVVEHQRTAEEFQTKASCEVLC
jgi:hypothetical protein